MELALKRNQCFKSTFVQWRRNKRVCAACSGINRMDLTAIILIQEDACVILTNGFEEIHEIPTLIQKGRLCIQFQNIIHTLNGFTVVLKITCDTECIKGFQRHLLLYVSAAGTTSFAFEVYLLSGSHFDQVLIKLIHRISSRDIFRP